MSYPYTTSNNNPMPPIEVGEGRIGPPRQGVAAVTPTGAAASPLATASFGPQLAQALQAYPGALQAASDRQQKAYDEMEGVTKGYLGTLSEPNKNDMWGRFGAAMLAPTKTGSFFEGFGNAANAAMDAREQYRTKEQQRQEKLYHAHLGLSELAMNRPDPALVGMENTVKAYKMNNEVGGYIADEELGYGLTPQSPQELLADYQKNPRKYMGARGQAMITDARDKLAASAKTADERNWWMQQKQIESQLRQQEEAAKANMPKELTNLDKKTYLDAQRQNSVFVSGLRNLRRAKELGPQTYSGLLPNERAWIKTNTGIGLNEPEEASAHIEYQKIMQGEAIKQMAETLKGATTDYEMRAYIDMIADPTLPWKDKEPAVDRIIEFLETQSALNSDMMRSIDPSGSLFGGDPQARGAGTTKRGSEYLTPEGQIDLQALPPTAQDWVQSQLEKGVEEEKVIQILMERINRASE